MIRHVPFGRGHAYQLEPDQRIPAWPVADEPIELCATTEQGADAPILELPHRGSSAERLVMGSVDTRPAARSAPTVDLAAAATGSGRTTTERLANDARAAAGGTRLRDRFRSPDGVRRPAGTTRSSPAGERRAVA